MLGKLTRPMALLIFLGSWFGYLSVYKDKVSVTWPIFINEFIYNSLCIQAALVWPSRLPEQQQILLAGAFVCVFYLGGLDWVITLPQAVLFTYEVVIKGIKVSFMNDKTILNTLWSDILNLFTLTQCLSLVIFVFKAHNHTDQMQQCWCLVFKSPYCASMVQGESWLIQNFLRTLSL